MTQIRENLLKSFSLVKRDLMQVQEDLKSLDKENSALKKQLQDAKAKDRQLSERITKLQQKLSKAPKAKPKTKTVVKTVRIAPKRARKTYVASKTGNKLHADNCIFAQNIKPKSRVHYKSKVKALNQGLKLCDCLKK